MSATDDTSPADLSAVLEAFLAEIEGGGVPDVEDWVARHPGLEGDLEPCLRAIETMAAPPGLAQLDAFQVVRPLGKGGMGTVYLAVARSSDHGARPGQLVALKVLHGHLLERSGFFRRFLREAQLGRQVQHANVVRTLDVDAVRTESETLHYLVMEYVEGRTLRELKSEMDVVPEGLVREIGRQVAAGLAAIHRAGIVHRDLKPENVLITPDYQVRVMDLGVARPLDASLVLTQQGEFAGSVPYAAPEQFENRSVGPSADLYALGVLLYELATGLNPFRRDNAAATMKAHLEYVPPLAHEHSPSLSPFFASLLATLLAKSPDQRLATAAELGEVLARGEDASWWATREAGLLAAPSRRPQVPVPCATTLHGREAELERLARAWEDARTGRGAVVLLEGEAGIGKTRLLDTFLRSVQDGAHLLYGSYPPSGGAGALSDAITGHFGTAGLETALVPYLPTTGSLARAFAAVVRHQAPPADAEPLRGDALCAVIAELMRALAAERPLVWIVDDLHFADAESRKTILSMVRAVAGHRVLLLLASRPGLPEDELVHFGRCDEFRRVALGRLSARQVIELLREAFQSESLAESLGGKIAYKSDGVPFFVCEIVRALKEGQFIEEQPTGSWTESRVVEDITVPSAVRDLISARLEGLSDDDRNLLDVAAVQGYEFDAGLVALVWEMKPLVVLSRLAGIERRTGIVRAAGRRYRFDHHQIQEVLYESLSEPHREEYHATLAQAFANREQATGEVAEDLPGEATSFLAEHHLKGNRPKDAAPYLDRALQELTATYRTEAAQDLASRALAVPGLAVGESRVELMMTLASAQRRLGRTDAAIETLDEALDGAAPLDDAPLVARAYMRRGSAYQHAGKAPPALADLERAIALAEREGLTQIQAEAARHLGATLLIAGRAEDARRQLERALALARDASDRDTEAAVLVGLGNTHFDLGLLSEAKGFHEQAVEVARATGNLEYEGTAVGNLGNVYGRLGDVDRMQAHNERRLEIAREIGDRVGQAAALGNLAIARHMRGAWGEALALYERNYALAREIGDRHWQAGGLHNLGNLQLVLGQTDRAVAAQQEALALAREIGAHFLEPFAESSLAQALLQRGDLPEAEKHAQAALRLRRAGGGADGLTDALLSLGRILQESRDPDGARTLLEEARPLAAELGMPGFVVLVEARLASLPGGDVAAAMRALEEHEPALEATQALEAYALLWQATGATEHLEKARGIVGRLLDGAPPELRDSMVENVPLYRRVWR